MMIIEFATFGSSPSRNIFNSALNKDLDEDFRLSYSIEKVNLISLMSKPIDFDEKLIDSGNEFHNLSIKQDLSKDFLDFLKSSDVEYIIMDTFNDVDYTTIRIDDDSYITNSNLLANMEYYNLIKDNPQLDIHEDFDEYLEIWKSSCDSFFEFLLANRPDIKVILNMARECYTYIDDDGKKVQRNYYKRKSQIDNKLRDILDYYIIENYDVEILRFSEDTLIDKNNIFGLSAKSYEPIYFDEKNHQLAGIVQKNILYEYDNPVNRKLRELDRKDVLFDKKYDEIKF